jgi:hypothetical protein
MKDRSSYMFWGFHDGVCSQIRGSRLAHRYLALHTSTLKMEAEYSFETLVTTYKNIWCHTQEDNKLKFELFLLYVRHVWWPLLLRLYTPSGKIYAWKRWMWLMATDTHHIQMSFLDDRVKIRYSTTNSCYYRIFFVNLQICVKIRTYS